MSPSIIRNIILPYFFAVRIYKMVSVSDNNFWKKTWVPMAQKN